MNKEQNEIFLFAIAKEIKRSYECPVILITQKDYADGIYNTLISLHRALIQHTPTQLIIEIVNTFHSEWLQAVQDVENLQRAKIIPRKSVFKSLDYTMDCIRNRHKPFQQYINNLNIPLSQTEKELMQDELKAITDLQEINCYAALEKQNSLSNSADKEEFRMIIIDEIKELLNWLDRLYDFLALQLCKLLDLTQFAAELNKGLQEVIDEMASQFLNPDANKLLKSVVINKEEIGHLTDMSEDYCISFKDNYFIQISKQIEILKARIFQLKNEKSSSSALAIKHKLLFLEDRLESLENIKESLSLLNKQNCIRHENAETDNEEEYFHIFNHMLPNEMRGQLVKKLVQLWENAIDNTNTQSIISIMRSESNEVFCDDQGPFMVDEYGRKLYKKSVNHQTYQLDEMNNLVPLNDDEYHVYFYDECGRYYMSENGERMYKAHQCASEYILHKTGMMLKMSEMKQGVKYHYDTLGRFFYGEDNEKLYCNPDSKEIYSYRNDGLGNLVKDRQFDMSNVVISPVKPMVTEDSLYLKEAVGDALKKCIAKVVMVLPMDPVKYLADSLKKYHFDMKLKEKQQFEREKMMVEQVQERSSERELPDSK